LTPTASRQSKCSRPPVILIENGRYLPSLPLAFTIARFFGLKVEDMFG
jgi:putative transcriptional regulator